MLAPLPDITMVIYADDCTVVVATEHETDVLCSKINLYLQLLNIWFKIS